VRPDTAANPTAPTLRGREVRRARLVDSGSSWALRDVVVVTWEVNVGAKAVAWLMPKVRRMAEAFMMNLFRRNV
jgi:hypothetical protein